MTREDIIEKYILPACKNTWNEKIYKMCEEALEGDGTDINAPTNMTFKDAIYNLKQAKCVPYRKATFEKINELLELLEHQKKKDAEFPHPGIFVTDRIANDLIDIELGRDVSIELILEVALHLKNVKDDNEKAEKAREERIRKAEMNE